MNKIQPKRTYLSLLISSVLIPLTVNATPISPTLLASDSTSAENLYFSSAHAISGDGTVIGGISDGSTDRSGGAVIWQKGKATDLANLRKSGNKFNHSAVWAISRDGSTFGGEAYYEYQDRGRTIKARYPVVWLKGNSSPIRLATTRKDGLGTIQNRLGGSTEVSGKVSALNVNGNIAIGQIIPDKDIYDETAKLAVLWKRGETGWQDGTKPFVLATPFEKNTYYSPSSHANAINDEGNVIAGSADWIKSERKKTSFSKDQRPSVWTSEDLTMWKVTRLPVEKHDDFNGAAHASSADGMTLAGYTQTTENVKRNQAVVWKNNGQDKSLSTNWHFTYLKSLTAHSAEDHDAGSSFAYTLNKDGSIVGGMATIEQDCATTEKPDENCVGRPVVWYDTATKPLELNTLKADGSGNGAVYALNNEGTLAVGVADTDQTDGYAVTQKAVIWKITYPQVATPEAPKPSLPDTPPSQPTPPSVSPKAPVTHTVSSVEKPTSTQAGYSFAMAISGKGEIIGGIGESTTERGGAATIWRDGKATELLNFEGRATHAAVWAISQDGQTYAGEARGHYFRPVDHKKVISKYPAIWQNGSDKPIRLATLGVKGMGAVNNQIDNPTQVSGKVNHLSADGAFAVGQSIAPIDYTFDPRAKQAVLWKRGGSEWKEGTQAIHLENPFKNQTYYTPYADARTISHDGQVIAGSADWIGKSLEKRSLKDQRPTIWTDDGSIDWKVTRLNVKPEHNFNGAVQAINHDGSIAVGYTQVSNNVKQNQAVLWTHQGQNKAKSENWTFTYLKSLTGYEADKHDAGSSFAYALNKRGNIIAGSANIEQGCATPEHQDDNCVSRPVVWYDSHKVPVELNTLKTDGTGEGAIYALNDEGTTAVGISDTDLTDDFGRAIKKATVWKLDYTKVKPQVSEPISILDTRQTIGTLGNHTLTSISANSRMLDALTSGFDGFDTMDSNAYASADYRDVDLRNTFVAPQNALPTEAIHQTDVSKLYAAGQAGRVFVRTKAAVDNEKKHRSLLTQLNIGYVVNDHFAMGTALFHTPYSKTVNGYKRTRDNLGIGLYAQWKQAVENGHWYLRAATALNRYDAEIHRHAEKGTEQAKGDTHVASKSVTLIAGANGHILSGGQAGIYTGLRHTSMKQDAYQESGVTFPVSYDQVKFRDTTAVFGITASIPWTNKLFWEPKAEVEYSLSLNNPTYRATAEGIGEVKINADFKRAKANLSSTLRYNLSQTSSLDFTPYVGRSLSGHTYWGGSAGFSVQF